MLGSISHAGGSQLVGSRELISVRSVRGFLAFGIGMGLAVMAPATTQEKFRGPGFAAAKIGISLRVMAPAKFGISASVMGENRDQAPYYGDLRPREIDLFQMGYSRVEHAFDNA